jgi:trans-2,3-dihydro-3-hydroxyanthranilate isomerase
MFTQRMTEDPATGSATAATAAMLVQSHKVPDGETVLRFMQGVDLCRPSLLVARVLKRSGTVSAVRVGGRCIKAMEGSFYLPGQPE